MYYTLELAMAHEQRLDALREAEQERMLRQCIPAAARPSPGNLLQRLARLIDNSGTFTRGSRTHDTPHNPRPAYER